MKLTVTQEHVNRANEACASHARATSCVIAQALKDAGVDVGIVTTTGRIRAAYGQQHYIGQVDSALRDLIDWFDMPEGWHLDGKPEPIFPVTGECELF